MGNTTKILFVTVDTTGGGAERMMFNIIRSLDSTKQVRLLITSDQTCPAEVSGAFECKSLGKNHASAALVDIIKEVRSYKPDYLFTTSSSIGYMLVASKYLIYLMIGHRPKVIIRCAVPPSEVYFKSLKSILLRNIIKLTYRGADTIIAQTEYMRKDLISSYSLSNEKVQHIRNIIDTELLDRRSVEYFPPEYSNTNFNIIAAGALYSVKGFDLLIKALSSIDYRDRNARLYIIGKERYEQGYEQYLKSLIEKYDLTDYVFLLGHKTNPYPYIKNSDLLVMSSRKEGFPNVVLEALYLGTPVLASDCVDWTNIVTNGVNGYVTEKGNVNALKDSLEKCLSTHFDMDACRLENYDYNKLFK